MPDYTIGTLEILALALAKTDASIILKNSADWIESRKFNCPNCGEIGADSARQAERDKCCLIVCRHCDAIVSEQSPF